MRTGTLLTLALCGVAFSAGVASACSGSDATASQGQPDAAADSVTGWPDAGGDVASTDAGGDAATDADATDADATLPDPPDPRAPCATGDCWSAPALGSACGTSTINENFSTGLYNVHEFPMLARSGVGFDISLEVTGGNWNPALMLVAEDGTTLFDGERVLVGGGATLEVLDSGRGTHLAGVRITSDQDLAVSVFVTSWGVVDSGFSAAMPSDARYTLQASADCQPPDPSNLLSPPNFDPNDVVGGYYLLPDSDPTGLYTHKRDECSRGNKLLIDVIYTVATYWQQAWPSLSPIAVRDLNGCGDANHQTHDDGTHVDIVAGCATEVACTDNQPAIDLAKLFVDTGQVCGILNNDVDVQAVVNPYFHSLYSYAPWNGEFMRSVTGHDSHFHVRVMKPDGTCN